MRIGGFSVLPKLIPETINVAESADVTKNKKMSKIATIEVSVVNGIVFNNSNNARVSSS